MTQVATPSPCGQTCFSKTRRQAASQAIETIIAKCTHTSLERPTVVYLSRTGYFLKGEGAHPHPSLHLIGEGSHSRHVRTTPILPNSKLSLPRTAAFTVQELGGSDDSAIRHFSQKELMGDRTTKIGSLSAIDIGRCGVHFGRSLGHTRFREEIVCCALMFNLPSGLWITSH
ncbi:hypothetical protein BDN72DRAFT_452144 [Pluteus cervinus]|uniref:Uncharacterized protein n=1 Tax=Pluteus cervinus TaxID=181527 RepID=A0ACD3BCF7_9AGAR|nr:hypothetical protein BDN72DRAFT_452144 [Pluteus cervinus]